MQESHFPIFPIIQALAVPEHKEWFSMFQFFDCQSFEEQLNNPSIWLLEYNLNLQSNKKNGKKKLLTKINMGRSEHTTRERGDFFPSVFTL
jgi:hypothetical protein